MNRLLLDLVPMKYDFNDTNTSQARGHLLELATGEGKSCVIAFFAALQALQGKPVDVICSSPILAQRDEQEWREFYEAFGLSSASLPVSTQGKSSYKTTYSKKIIYGTVHDFTGDVLKQEFDEKETRGSRDFASLIVDEVDHLTLDSCLSTTYLSHHARGLHHLNLVLAAVWQLVTSMLPLDIGFYLMPQRFLAICAALVGTSDDGGVTELDVLSVLVFEKHLLPESFFRSAQQHYAGVERLRNEEKDESSLERIEQLKNSFWTEFKEEVAKMDPDAPLEDNMSKLICALPIDTNIYRLDEDNKPEIIVEEEGCKNKLLIFPNGMLAIYYEDAEAKENIRNELLKMISGLNENKRETDDKSLEAYIHVPTFLHRHVREMLPDIIDNAFFAAYHMEEGVAYKVTKSADTGDENSHMFDSIIPVDFASTGILEKNKKYSGVQQFLEMKHQLSISDATMTTNFMSNFTFYTRFEEIHGLTGTLGTQFDREFLKEKLLLQSSSIPSHKRTLVRNYPMKVVREVAWIQTILDEANAFCTRGQPVLIICKDMKTAAKISDEIKSSLPAIKNIPYWRDDNQKLPREVNFEFPGRRND